MNGTHYVLAYGDINFIGDDIRIKINLLNAFKNIGLTVNTGKTKFMEVGRHHGMMANVHIAVVSNSYEKVKAFKYVGSLVANQNCIQEEIKSRLKAKN